MSSRVKRAFSLAAITVALSLVATGPRAEAQVYYGSLHGQWTGSHDLVQITQEHTAFPLEEITHAIILPEHDGQVVLW